MKIMNTRLTGKGGDLYDMLTNPCTQMLAYFKLQGIENMMEKLSVTFDEIPVIVKRDRMRTKLLQKAREKSL